MLDKDSCIIVVRVLNGNSKPRLWLSGTDLIGEIDEIIYIFQLVALIMIDSL